MRAGTIFTHKDGQSFAFPVFVGDDPDILADELRGKGHNVREIYLYEEAKQRHAKRAVFKVMALPLVFAVTFLVYAIVKFLKALLNH